MKIAVDSIGGITPLYGGDIFLTDFDMYSQAGIASPEDPDQLILALEPEAASYYCRKLPFNRFKGNQGDCRVVKETLDKEKVPYMVVDNGG